jgi:hypothetical protein
MRDALARKSPLTKVPKSAQIIPSSSLEWLMPIMGTAVSSARSITGISREKTGSRIKTERTSSHEKLPEQHEVGQMQLGQTGLSGSPLGCAGTTACPLHCS